MNVALGLKAHSGWAALVVLGERSGEPCLVDRRRISLIENERALWAKQPYHAAENLKPDRARDIVTRGVDGARRSAVREMEAAVERMREAGHEIAGCGVLVGAPMPDWSVDEILAVHFRMHTAEGVLFRNVLVHAARDCGLKVVEIPEKQLTAHAVKARQIAALGKSVGPPWAKDQKDAALAAMIAL